ncbi:GNAT family N-acetyltransferase [Ruminococcus sp.]|uniref:GNAT family N-acetyltransferase n=1 Tax=Ruminococcus sp. TaxID=41978 RepID=UPI0025F17CFA|nr:GNAT family N-acetyltransferase [Ruminococcus sp.]MBQ8967697.1 GNAT family N-acetyltransferase [Ruminococcus sp.]
MIKTENREKIMPMFSGFEDSVLISCAEGRVGKIYCDDPNFPAAAVICAGDFYFTAGNAGYAAEAFALAEDNSEAVFMPLNDEWTDALLGLGRGLVKTTRFRTDMPEKPDMERLAGLADLSAFPEYKLEMINEEYYHQALEEVWSRAFVYNFLDYNDFSRNGFGCCITHEGRLICGASCYSSYSGGVEVEIATHPDHRRKGLATIAGAAFIAECARRGLKAHWDAANMMSLKIAEKFGYILKEEYTALCFEEG